MSRYLADFDVAVNIILESVDDVAAWASIVFREVVCCGLAVSVQGGRVVGRTRGDAQEPDT